MAKPIVSKNLIIYTLIIVSALCLYELARRKVGGFAGSYPFAEAWTIKHSIEDVELELKELHNSNPNLFSDTSKLSLKHHPIGSWKEVFFYYDDRFELVKVRFRHSENNRNHTTILLVSFINEKTGSMRLMNRDFNFFANQREKRIFENRILKYLL